MPLTPNYEAFVQSLDDAEAAFLHAVLQGVRGQKAMGLRESLLNRVLDAESPGTLREEMEARFFQVTRPKVLPAAPIRRSK
jgi:hypothetical protein